MDFRKNENPIVLRKYIAEVFLSRTWDSFAQPSNVHHRLSGFHHTNVGVCNARDRLLSRRLGWVGQAIIREVLDSCLLTDQEMRQGRLEWATWPCPWDVFR